MSEEKAEVVRQSLLIRADSRRTLAQMLYVRFPRITRGILRFAWRFLRLRPPRSWYRRAVVRIVSRRACEALNRRDLELFSVIVHPEIESVNTASVVGLGGLVPGSRGREKWIAGQTRWLADWEELRYEPDEVLDLGGDRVLLLGRGKGTGRASGIVIDTEWGLLATISDGLLAREENFLDRKEALEAAGLSE